jgi:ribokinase
MAKKCLVLGDLNIDLIFFGLKDRLSLGSEILSNGHCLDIGGSGGIFASALSQLGIDTFISSVIGNDYLGRILLNKMNDFSVGTEYLIIRDDFETGITATLSYSKNKSQVSSLEIFRLFKDNPDIILRKISGIENLSHIHFPSYYMIRSFNPEYGEIIHSLRRKYENVTFSLDTNDDPKDSWDDVFDVLKSIDILFLNEKEALNISKEKTLDSAINKLGSYIKTVVIKLGDKGFMARTPAGDFKDKSLKAEFCDSTGAGDNFDAGFIYGYLKGYGYEKSLEIANMCGAKSVEHPGGVGDRKGFSEIKELIRKIV